MLGRIKKLLLVRMLLMLTFPKAVLKYSWTHPSLLYMKTPSNDQKRDVSEATACSLLGTPAVRLQTGKVESTTAKTAAYNVLPRQYSTSLESAPGSPPLGSQKDLNNRCQNCDELTVQDLV